MSSSSAPAHRSVTSIRRPSNAAASPASPTTPVRTISSAYGSPSSLRSEEDNVIIEIGCRFMRAGFASDAAPKAIIAFEPELQRRAGDFRNWEAGYQTSWRKRAPRTWADNHELWRLDIRELDLELAANKLTAATRLAYTKYLLLDNSRPRRITLVLPSGLPLALLSTVLDALFQFQPSTISLLSSPVLSTVAAGLRSAIVVDIGWYETVVTSVYEYREIQHRRSTRAGRWLSQEMLRTLAKTIEAANGKDAPEGDTTLEETTKRYMNVLSFEEVEEVTARMAWCKPLEGSHPNSTVTIPFASTEPPTSLEMPFETLAEPCERAFLAAGLDLRTLDDDELTLPMLLYQSLLQLPVDVRSLCMARIVFTGGSSNIPGLKDRILDELAQIVRQRGWDPVVGKAADRLRDKMANMKIKSSSTDQAADGGARDAEQESDLIDERLQREAQKGTRQTVHGVLRSIESLGAWSGASLLSFLKIPAVTVIERDQWLLQGLSGASKPGEISLAKQRQSLGPGGLRTGDRTSWTLGTWA